MTKPFILTAEDRAKLRSRVLATLKTGRQNAITGKDIAHAVGQSDDRKVRLIIRELIAEGVPVASSVSEPMSFYIVANEHEAANYIQVLKERIREDTARLGILRPPATSSRSRSNVHYLRRCEMPIKGVSEVRRLPRLGKIRLGVKVQGDKKNPYPRAVDYFVVPEEIQPYVGEKSKKLRIMFPVEDPEVFAPQFLKCYSFTQGLVCRGDGITCTRKVDTETGDVASHVTEHWEFSQMSCDPDTCPEAVGDPEMGIRPQCRRVMNLLFVLPDVPGLGVWQLDTSSFYSIVNINSCIDVIRGLCGRISGIPLTLSLEPREVTPPGLKKKTVHVLHLRSNLKLGELQRLATRAPKALAMPKAEEEEPPEDLFPEEVPSEAEGVTPETAADSGQLQPEPKRDPETIRSLNELFRTCHEDFGMQPRDVLKELGVSSQNEISELPSECYRRIAAVR